MAAHARTQTEPIMQAPETPTPLEADNPQGFVGPCSGGLSALRKAIERQQADADAAEGADAHDFLDGWVWGLEEALCLLFPEASECR